MLKNKIHEKICERKSQVDEWFQEQGAGLVFPIYSSFDIRDSGFKIAPVDANIFPAGFNNICTEDKESSSTIMRDYLKHNYPEVGAEIVLLTEEHTNNGYYWENIKTLNGIITEAGYKVLLANPGVQDIRTVAASGDEIFVPRVSLDSGVAYVEDTKMELVVSNNDFSDAYNKDWESLKTPLNPPYAMGWHRREKSQFFTLYNELASQFADLLNIDPFVFKISTESFSNFELNSEASRNQLAKIVDQRLEGLKQIYLEKAIDAEPYLFVKNSSGTYGLAVIRVSSGEDVQSWNYKSRKKMKAAKGGGEVQGVIVQEGISSQITENDATAEPAIYMIGDKLAGGFLRVHSKKGPEDNLNSPGAIYRKLCVSDLNVDMTGCVMENVYGWVAKLGALAVAQEINAANEH